MGFFKNDNIYKITRITGSQDNILSVTFDDKNNSDTNIEVIECDFFAIDKSKIQTSKEKASQQVFLDWSWSIDLLEQIINYLKFIFHLLIAKPIQFTIY